MLNFTYTNRYSRDHSFVMRKESESCRLAFAAPGTISAKNRGTRGEHNSP